MKKAFTILLSFFVLNLVFLTSCKKKDNEPTPDNTPRLKAGVTTTFTISSGDAEAWILTDDIEDPQGDTWVVSSVTSSNSNVMVVRTSTENNQAAVYEGVSAGTATITIVITDSTGATRSITGTVTVYNVVEATPVEAVPVEATPVEAVPVEATPVEASQI